MTKSEAIEQLKNQVAPKGQQASLEAVGIAITALETEKEPDTAGTVTSSKEDQMKIFKTNCYQYDNTEPIICQALRLAKLATELGAQITYNDGVFVIDPKAGECNA